MSFTLTFTLKQHTPILHFQHDQPGATLRATEVKPKLDLFIMEKMCSPKKGDAAREAFKALHPEWLVGNGNATHIALDYKISFDSGPSSEWLILNNISERYLPDIRNGYKSANDVLLTSPFFANNQHLDLREVQNSKWEEMRKGVFAKEPIKGKVICFVKELRVIIGANLRLFFAANNFGTRQSKGLGSFTVEKINSVRVQGSDNDFIREHIHEAPEVLATYVCDKNLDVKGRLKKVVDAWKYLKAGDSFKEYEKSNLMKYFCSTENIRWEKRAIKKSIKSKASEVWEQLKYDAKSSDSNIISGCKDDENEEKYQYIRALLGLAEHNEYGTFNTRDSVKILINDKLASNIQTKHLAADRFKSPLTFKITADAIFMFVHPIPASLSRDENGKDSEFEFVLSGKIGGREIPRKTLATLTVPKAASLEMFLDAIWLDNNLNPGEFGDTNARNEGFQKIIKPIK